MRSLLVPFESKGKGGRRLFGGLLQDARCKGKNGICVLEETDAVPGADGGYMR
jgi:hypothetical protein